MANQRSCWSQKHPPKTPAKPQRQRLWNYALFGRGAGGAPRSKIKKSYGFKTTSKKPVHTPQRSESGSTVGPRCVARSKGGPPKKMMLRAILGRRAFFARAGPRHSFTLGRGSVSSESPLISSKREDRGAPIEGRNHLRGPSKLFE